MQNYTNSSIIFVKSAGVDCVRKSHKVLIISAVIIVLITLITINIYQSYVNKANEIISEIDVEIRDELYMDAKQVFETLEQAHNEQRELTIAEKQLVNEFDAKYNRESVELTFDEKMIVNNILLMSYEVVPTSQLKSEQNRYEEYKNNLLEYVEFE